LSTNSLRVNLKTPNAFFDDYLVTSNRQIEIAPGSVPILKVSSVILKPVQLFKALPGDFFEKIPIFVPDIDMSLACDQFQIEVQIDSVDFNFQASNITGGTKNKILDIDFLLDNFEIDHFQLFQKLSVHTSVSFPKDYEIIYSF
jgi:hypothetical protein